MKRLLFLFFIFMIIFSCTESDISQEKTPDWLIDRSKVTGELNLFALSQEPEFSSVSKVTLSDNDLVAMISFGNEIRVYPYRYTNSFEIINDVFNGVNISISYCPITKSGICFNRNINGSVTNFRASGYLFNNNLMPYDEKTESIWSQMRQQAVNGPLAGTKFKTFNLIETKWSTVKENFNSAKVFTSDKNGIVKNKAVPEEKGDDVDGAEAPEGGDFVFGLFPNSSSDNLVIYEYNQFNSTRIFDFESGSRNIIIVGDASKRIISSYFIEEKGQFEEIKDKFPIVMRNKKNGSEYNIFGKAISGPDNGKQLGSPRSFVAIWWAWKEFYTNFRFNDLE